METLFQAGVAEEIKARAARLRPESERLWGKMTAAQAMAHCAIGFEWAMGDKTPPRMFLLSILGRIVKPMALGEKPLRRNSPTAPELVIADVRDLDREREKLFGLIDRFAGGGPAVCTKQPHSFFGSLKPEEWARLMYKHLDHHLRQFGV